MTRSWSRPFYVPPAVIAVLLSIVAGATFVGTTQQTTNTAYVTVLDNRLNPVTGLTAAEVTILENGAGRDVLELAPADEPLAIALLVDTAQPPLGTHAITRDLRQAAATFVTRVHAAQPGSRFALMETGGAAVTTVSFTANRNDIDRGIGQLFQTQRTSAVVLEALQAMSRQIGEQRETRRVMVSIDVDSQDTSRIKPDEFAAAIQLAGASVVAVSVRGQGTPSPGRNGVLAWITDLTGGLRLTGIAASALEAQLQTVARALTSQYRVTYRRPAGTPVGQLRGQARRGSKVLVTRAFSN